MRTAAKVDGNHSQILDALNKFPGMRAVSTAPLGKGRPDILAAFRGATVWLEVKQPGEKPNAAQIEFLATWPGKAYVVSDPDEAIGVVVAAAKPAHQGAEGGAGMNEPCVCGHTVEEHAPEGGRPCEGEDVAEDGRINGEPCPCVHYEAEDEE